jgi:hypothetical protein
MEGRSRPEEEIMKQTSLAVAAALALGMLTTQDVRAAISQARSIPAGQEGVVVIQANPAASSSSGGLTLKFAAPGTGSYTLVFCVGPASNPCGDPGSYVVKVPVGEDRLAVIRDDAFFNRVLFVATSDIRSVDTPFVVTIE